MLKSWPHAPLHSFSEKGTYIITGATYDKELIYKSDEELDLLHNLLLELADQYKIRLEAWAVFSNHYHSIAHSSEDPTTLKKFLKHLHNSASRNINKMQNKPGRKVWYQFWDTLITYQTSYLARLNYVMNNPVKHKLVNCASQYKWCSANWFEKNANRAYFNTVMSFETSEVNVIDDY